MKRFFLLLVAAISIVNFILADNTIQNTFIGLKLGKASQNEVQNVLTSQGFELQTDTGGFFVYQGNWQIEGVPVKNVVTRFMDDTLMMMVFANSCENKCDSIQRIINSNVEQKYGSLQSGDSSVFIKLFSLGMVSLEMEQWSRMDEETSFMYAKSDSGYVFIYLAENFMWNQFAKSVGEILNDNSIDYAEENKVYGVAGVKFGDNKESVKRIILTKSENIVESDAHHMTFGKVKVGGLIYTYGEFYFLQGKGLVAVSLSKVFKSWQEEEAKVFYENIVSQYKGKYTNFKENQDGDYAFCGAYMEDYKDMLPIVISRKKSLSRGGDMMYYVEVSYYIQRLSGLYNDEI